MQYYKILPEYDGKARKDGLPVIAGELYTRTEMENYSIPLQYATVIDTSSRSTHWYCGARWPEGKVPER